MAKIARKTQHQALWFPNSSDPMSVANLRMSQLTPDGVANVVKRMFAPGLSSTLDPWNDELSAEHPARRVTTQAAVGFMGA